MLSDTLDKFEVDTNRAKEEYPQIKTEPKQFYDLKLDGSSIDIPLFDISGTSCPKTRTGFKKDADNLYHNMSSEE